MAPIVGAVRRMFGIRQNFVKDRRIFQVAFLGFGDGVLDPWFIVPSQKARSTPPVVATPE